MADPSWTKQEEFWDDWVSRSFAWENNPDNVRRGAYVLSEIAKCSQKDMKILDIGCGSGWLSRELVKYGDVTATDLSFKNIQKLRDNFPDIHWIAGDFHSIKLPLNYFHIVTCLETIAHVPNHKKFAHRIAEVTRAGGTLLLTTQNEYIWSCTSSLKPSGEGQMRNWPSRDRLMQLFHPHFTIEKIFTCAPGGDRKLPALFNNRISNAIGNRLFGREKWILLRESWGLGRSLFLVAKRRGS